MSPSIDPAKSALTFHATSTIFYVSYLLFEWPQALALQRFPVGKWMSINIMCWALFLMLHAACHNASLSHMFKRISSLTTWHSSSLPVCSSFASDWESARAASPLDS